MADGLKRQRSACKGGLTKIVKFANELTDGGKLTVEDIKSRLNYARELMDRFIALEEKLLDYENEKSELNEFEDDYLTAISKLNSALRKRNSTTTRGAEENEETANYTMNQPINHVRYAKIDIPTFSGDPTEFQSFIDLFNAAVHNMESYTDSQRFQLLKRYLSGEAAALVRHLPITDANYEEARSRLTERYDRKKVIVNSFVRKFISIAKISKSSPSCIRHIHDTADEVLRGLKALGENAEARDWWLIYILLEKMDDETKSLWAQESVTNDNPLIKDFLKFLDTRVTALEAVNVYSATKYHSSKRATNTATKATSLTASTTVIDSKSSSCPLCAQEPHRLIDCPKYIAMSVKQRQDHIQSQNRCFNCLNSGHRIKNCISKSRCNICHRRHHRTLHIDEQKQQNSKSETVMSALMQPKTQQRHTPSPNSNMAVLPTAIVLIEDNNGVEREYRALLDSGSQASFVTESCSQQLAIKRSHSRVVITGIGNASAGQSRGMVKLCIKPKFKSYIECINVNALVIPKIAAQLPELVNHDDLQWLSNVQLADEKYYGTRNIDILLGADVFFEILEEGRFKSPTSRLIAQKTKLGWIIGGSSNVQQTHAHSYCATLDIDATLRRFWEIEDVGSSKSVPLSEEETTCLNHYKENTTRANDGKFITRLPFKSPHTSLCSNYFSALQQFKALERRFQQEPILRQLYCEFLDEYQKLGHMKRVEGPINQLAYYMPHHGVLKLSNTTTKLRVVFNASSKTGHGNSLNNILMTGPTVQSTLWAILLRYRLYEFVFSADIEKMYRQVWVHSDDQPHQMILWRDDKSNICAYQMTTVTYGTSSAPFVATHTLNELASSFKQSHPRAATSIQSDVYVDDVLKGATSLEELISLKNEICAI